MNTKKFIVLIAVALILMAGACGGPPSPVATTSPEVVAPTAVVEPATQAPAPTEEPTVAPPKKIVVGITAGPLALDVYHDPNVISQSIGFSILEPLVILSHDMSKVLYRLATSIENTDPLTWVVKLREGVKWHDGTPFTSADVVFTFDLMSSESANLPHKYPAGIVKNVTAEDEYTVKIVTEEPYAIMIRRLVEFPMLPKHAVEAMGLEEFPAKPVGTGPYVFVEWVKDSHVALTANPDWWAGKPLYDEVVYRIIPDASTRQADLLAGTIDLMAGLSPDLVSTIESREGLEVVAVPSLRCMAIIFNPRVKPLDDVRVRQAINYAIDRQTLIDDLLGGYAVRSYEQLTETDFGFTLEGVETYEYNPEKAKELLAEAGYPDGFELELQLGQRFTKGQELMQAVQSMLEEVGIKLNIVPMEWGTFFSEYWNSGKMTFGLYGFANMIGDGDLPLFYNYHSSSMGGKYFNTPELDQLIEAQQSELDPVKREAILHDIVREVVNNADRVDLFRYSALFGQKAGLEWFPRSDERILLYELE